MLTTLAILTFLTATLDGRVLLRDRVADPIQNVVEVSAGGVKAGAPGSEQVIPWHEIASVEGSHAAVAQMFLAGGEELWRALARLNRGDLPSAEVMLERFKGDMVTTPGPTAEAIWMGLLRCRLDRGAQTAAAAAWISWSRVRAQGAPPESEDGVSSDALPDAAGLVPAIPPIWLNVPSVAVIASAASDPWKPDAAAPPIAVEILKAWYIRAARGACGLGATSAPGSSDTVAAVWPEETDDRRIQLVAAIVRAQYGDDKERLTARESLKTIMIQRTEPWVEAWVRVAIGRSLLKEHDPEIRRLGVVELLHVPARLESVVPYLTGIALADAAAALRAMGDLEGASNLRDELLRRYGGHPATEWGPVRDWPLQPPRKQADADAKDPPEN